jgi:hypothetical protein
VNPNAGFVDAFEIRPPPDALGPGQALRHPSSATVSRFRPFARRRFRTIRPFFVVIRTRKPCVFFRRRVFGWNVRFPLGMRWYLDSAPGESGRIFNGSRRRDAVSTRGVCVTVLRPSPKASRTRRSRLGFLPSFPHLWKTLWKSAAEHKDPLKMACFYRFCGGEAVAVGSCSDVFAGDGGFSTEV